MPVGEGRVRPLGRRPRGTTVPRPAEASTAEQAAAHPADPAADAPEGGVPEGDHSSADFWSGRYVEHNTPWDLGVPSPALEWALARGLLQELGVGEEDVVLVPGCGRGHDLLPFLRRGLPTVGIDFAPPAVAEAREVLRQNGYDGDVLCRDLFGLGPEHDGRYRLILDHTCTCALPRYLRDRYAASMARWLQPGGHLVHLTFPADPDRDPTEGPPFRMLREDCEAIFGPHLDPVDSRIPGASHPRRWQLERIDIWRRPESV